MGKTRDELRREVSYTKHLLLGLQNTVMKQEARHQTIEDAIRILRQLEKELAK